MKNTSLICGSLTALALIFSPIQSAASVEGATISETDPLTRFTPRPSKTTKIDYDAWDFILSEIVLYMGPSTRKRSSRATPQVGTRLIRTHASPYRMEGNKVMYSLIENSVEVELEAYAKELEELGSQIDISTLSRNEQLAYWINLHNAVLITTIQNNYPGPSRRPEDVKPLKGADARLHDAKLMEVDGIKLSLRDIRERIVFPNWQDADVAFAFHLGHLGGPSMANFAYTSQKLKAQLSNNASEYVNSLRAYDDGRLGEYFYDISPWFFQDFEADLTKYFRRRMRTEVFEQFKSVGITGRARSEKTIADMSGGYGKRGGMERFYANLQSSNFPSGLGANIEKFLVERAAKSRQLQKQDWFKRGTVIIEDIETDDGQPVEIE